MCGAVIAPGTESRDDDLPWICKEECQPSVVSVGLSKLSDCCCVVGPIVLPCLIDYKVSKLAQY